MTPTKEKPITDWATAAGRETARRRSEREAEAAARAQAEDERGKVPQQVLEQRFADVMKALFAHVDAFAIAAAITIEADHIHPHGFKLVAHGRTDVLDLHIEEEMLVAILDARSRREEERVDLTDDAFAPAELARTLAARWVRNLEAEERYHAAR